MNKQYVLRFLSAAALLMAATVARAIEPSVDSVVTSNLFEPYAVAASPDGTFYITDGANNRIMKVNNGASSATLLAGEKGVPGTNEGFANIAHFYLPQGIVLARGGLVVADSANHMIRFVSFQGAVTNIAGAAGAYGNADGVGSDARFRYPLGLAADSAGNIYIADSQNNAIRKLDPDNNVTTVATGFFQPAGLAVGDNGDIWVTDTRRHCIKVISTNGTITLVAGVPTVSGQTDSMIGTTAQFSSPRGLLWVSSTSGLLVSDSGNHTIRRVYWNPVFNTYSVETYAGVPGTIGAQNGTALSSTFNSPVGLASDGFSGGFLVVDKGNNQIRRINTGVVQSPVADPVIGWVDFIFQSGAYVTLLRPVVSAVFNNEVIIAIKGELGTQTYFTAGNTPSNPLEDTIPDPAAGTGNTPPAYSDGRPASSAPTTLALPQPDLTVKAIGTLNGRRSSSIVQSRFQFQVGGPSILGDNAASFIVQCVTTNAELWYTWDGSEPTNNPLANTNVIGPVTSGDIISFNLDDKTNTFKIRGFRPGFRPSEVSVKTFFPADFVANQISLGFSSGEASSDFVGAAGQRFYAPVTLSLLPAQTIYSLQFNVTATNLVGNPLDPTTIDFESMLEKPGIIPGTFDVILPEMPDGSGGFASLLIPNYSINLLEVGWLERFLATNLFNTLQQDLVKYSQAHDTLFNSGNGKVITGAYSFVIPSNAVPGSAYQIKLGRASATSDGIGQDVYIKIPTNGTLAGGAINGTKNVTVASRPYIVGDCAPFRWFNAGDFGEGFLLNNDVLQTFQSAVYLVNSPPNGSDFFDVMDSSDGSVNDLFFGDIDQIQFGDGQLNIDDVYVTFRRSLDPTLKWYARYWSNGVRQAIEVTNVTKSVSSPGKKALGTPKSLTNGIPSVVISADDLVGAPGATVQVPIRVHVSGGLPIKVAMLGVSVEPLDGSASYSAAVSFGASSALGTPTIQQSTRPSSAAAVWLNDTVTGVAGDSILGTVSFTIPNDATPSAAYRIHFDHFSASENGLSLFRKNIRDGLVTVANRSASTLGDGISDSWRLRYFGSATDVRSLASADPDGDGVSNQFEFLAGTNPLDANSSLRLRFSPAGSGLKLGFPTGMDRSYVIECAPALSGPWAPISTNLGNGGTIEFTHSAPGNGFYRVQAR